MIVATFIPFFLAVQLPIEDGAWPYGPEYIFTVHTNVSEIPSCNLDVECTAAEVYRIVSRLHCIPKRNDTLSCSLKYVDGYGTTGNYVADDVLNRWRNITDVPIELLFNERGIKSIITSQLTRIHDLNILKMVTEQLHPGDNLKNIEDDTFEGEAASTVGRCNVTFKVRYLETYSKILETKDFRLKLLTRGLHIPEKTAPLEVPILYILKKTKLDDCSCYADNYTRRYGDTGDTVVDKLLRANLTKMSNVMMISETSFSSATYRDGALVSKEPRSEKRSHLEDIIKIILEDIRPAARDPPTIVKPGETNILLNHVNLGQNRAFLNGEGTSGTADSFSVSINSSGVVSFVETWLLELVVVLLIIELFKSPLF